MSVNAVELGFRKNYMQSFILKHVWRKNYGKTAMSAFENVMNHMVELHDFDEYNKLEVDAYILVAFHCNS